MKTNLLKEKLKAGTPVFGTFLALNSPCVCEILANTGFDFLLIDGEHGLLNLETEAALVLATKGTGATPLIRVSHNDQAVIKRALDAGPAGVMVPMVAGAEDAAKAVSFCLYPPQGVRGVGLGYACLFGVDMQDYLSRANDELLKIIQIEHIDAVRNIDAILDVPGIDVAFVGPMDLSGSMGILGQLTHPELSAAIEKVSAAAKKRGINRGIFCANVDAARAALAQGFTFIALGIDAGFLISAASQSLRALKEGAGA